MNGIPNSGVFYDIGANVGYFSVEMAMKLGDAVKVVAFEPQGQTGGPLSLTTHAETVWIMLRSCKPWSVIPCDRPNCTLPPLRSTRVRWLTRDGPNIGTSPDPDGHGR